MPVWWTGVEFWTISWSRDLTAGEVAAHHHPGIKGYSSYPAAMVGAVRGLPVKVQSDNATVVMYINH